MAVFEIYFYLPVRPSPSFFYLPGACGFLRRLALLHSFHNFLGHSRYLYCGSPSLPLTFSFARLPLPLCLPLSRSVSFLRVPHFVFHPPPFLWFALPLLSLRSFSFLFNFKSPSIPRLDRGGVLWSASNPRSLILKPPFWRTISFNHLVDEIPNSKADLEAVRGLDG